MSSNPFDYVTSILNTKENLIIDSQTEKEYVPFLVNRGLSYHKDCLMWANEMNIKSNLDNKLQFDFLINTVKGYKRPFEKWIKKEKTDDVIIIKDFFQVSYRKAMSIISLLTDEQIKEIKEKMNPGGA